VNYANNQSHSPTNGHNRNTNRTEALKLLHVSATRRHPQGISNTKECKHQYINHGGKCKVLTHFKTLKL